MFRSPSYQADTDECVLTPAEDEPESRVIIIFVRQFSHFKYGAVFIGDLFFEFLLCHYE